MPIYVYFCEECQKKVESLSSIENYQVFCPFCEKEMKKIPTAANFTVNGFNSKNNYGIKNGRDKKN